MRPKERINIFFKYCNTKKKFVKFIQWLELQTLTRQDERNVAERVMDSKKDFKKVWKEGWNCDLRLTQFLVSQGFLYNEPGMWYYKEEQQFLLEVLKIAPEKVLLWGQNYDKDMNRLKKTKYRLIEKMTTEHIKAIMDHVEKGEMKVHPMYEIYFAKVLKDRDGK